MQRVSKLEDASVGVPAYIEDLRGFLSNRGMEFGTAAQIEPFLLRLRADPSFRDEMSSMMRAVIYRARDGFAECELIDVVLVAVGGIGAQKSNECMQELVSFVRDVFRSRWNTVPAESEQADEAVSDSTQNVAPGAGAQLQPDAANEALSGAAYHALRPESSMFWRAHALSVEHGQQTTPAEPAKEPQATPQPEWSGTLLESYDSEPASRRWVWNLGFGALLLVFCGGLFFAQRSALDMFQQRRAPAHVIAVSSTNSPDGSSKASAMKPPPPLASPVGNAVALAKPSAAVRLEGSIRRSSPSASLGAGTRPVDLAQTAHYRPVALGVSPAIMRSRLIYAPRTDYPTIARLAHIQGKVQVEAIVSRRGHVVHADVISGHRLLRSAALKAVRARRYRPYLVDGKPADVATILTVNFRLHR